MSNEVIFVDGLIVKAPHQNAPDFVKAQLSIKREELIAWLQGQGRDWVNLDIKESRNGKWYASLNDWKPKQDGRDGSAQSAAPRQAGPPPDGGFIDDEIPF